MYGANTRQMREALTSLLRQQGTDENPTSTPAEKREDLGQLLSRYRRGVLAYCRIAVAATRPNADRGRHARDDRRYEDDLRDQLDRAIRGLSDDLPTLDELVTPQDPAFAEAWRLAAHAAALGEHDFPAGLTWESMSDVQARTVLRDAAEITQAIALLDQPQSGLPGWKPLPDRRALGRAAAACAATAGYDGQDHTIDLLGWRPALKPIGSPDPGGLSGVLEAQQNLFVHLANFPNAHSLRMVIDSQRVLSHDLAKRAEQDFPTLAGAWRKRAQTYTKLGQECRNVAGLIGSSRAGHADAAILVGRLSKAAASDPITNGQANGFSLLFERIDTRLADVIKQGTIEQLYLLRVPLPELSNESTGLIHGVRAGHMPITAAKSNLLRIAKEDLRPAPRPASPPVTSIGSRMNLQDALTYRTINGVDGLSL